MSELSVRYKKSVSTLKRQFDKYENSSEVNSTSEKELTLVMDATFFSRKFGVLIFRSNSKNIIWKYIESEKINYYKHLLLELKSKGFIFKSFTIDGRRGVRQMLNLTFPGVPVQQCQFHQIFSVTTYLSKNPKLNAGKELRQLSLTLSKTSKEVFTNSLENWYGRWEQFLKEKTKNEETGKEYYTHRKLRSAYSSLKNNLDYLFTYEEFPDLEIPKTTNSCDGSFAHWKSKVKLHRGLAKERKKKMIDYLLKKC